jgi:predicted RNA-binding Zn ribbon-like protein
VPCDVVPEIDRILRRNAGSFRLRRDGNTLRLVFEPRRTHPLSAVAEAAARLFSGPDRKLVGRCGNPECGLFFLDRTRNHRRRWCSMGICGNRRKVAAWRARQRRQLSSRPLG